MQPDASWQANHDTTYGALHPAASGADPRQASQAFPSYWVEALGDALLSDLKVLPRLAAELPSGGVPRAGYLAQHCYVICEALEHHLSCHGDVSHRSGTGRIADQADQADDGQNTALEELRGALGEVTKRIERLYSADRPGGLDRIEAHLWRLYRATAICFEPDPARSNPDPLCDGWMSSSWFDGLGHHPRARILAWAVAADPSRAEPLRRAQPLITRLLVAAACKRRARHRAERLGLPRHRPSTGLAA